MLNDALFAAIIGGSVCIMVSASSFFRSSKSDDLVMSGCCSSLRMGSSLTRAAMLSQGLDCTLSIRCPFGTQCLIGREVLLVKCFLVGRWIGNVMSAACRLGF